jgi:hypothetical protein
MQLDTRGGHAAARVRIFLGTKVKYSTSLTIRDARRGTISPESRAFLCEPILVPQIFR